MKNRVLRLRLLLLILDLIWTAAALWIAFQLRYPNSSTQESFRPFLPLMIAAPVVWLLVYFSMELDCFRWTWNIGSVIARVFLGEAVLIGVLLTGQYLLRDYISRLSLAYYMVLLFCGFVFIRCAARLLLLAYRELGTGRRIVISGTDRVCQELADKIEKHPELLCEVVGFLYLEDGVAPPFLDAGTWIESKTVRSLGIAELLKKERVDELIVALPPIPTQEVQNVIAACRNNDIKVSIVPQSYELYLSKPQLRDIGGVPLLSLERAQIRRVGRIGKRMADLLLVIVLGLACLPMLAIFGAILRVRKGRAFTSHLRVGEHGRTFYMYRFNIDRDQPQLNWLERFIRHYSLSELPQLLNILRGDMSMVGPRPEAPERVKYYSDWQRQRLNVAPGLTGLAQVHGLREVHSSDEKASFDLQYILGWSVGLDISLILQTTGTLLRRTRILAYRETTVKLTAEESES